MNWLSWIFGKKEDLSKESFSQKSDYIQSPFTTEPPPLPNSKFDFTRTYTEDNCRKLVKYWYDNYLKWCKEYENIEFDSCTLQLSDYMYKTYLDYKDKDSYNFYYMPSETAAYIRVYKSKYSQLQLKVEAIERTSVGFDHRINNNKTLEIMGLFTQKEQYEYLYDLTANMKFVADPSKMIKSYIEKNLLPLDDSRSDEKYYSVNNGEYYILRNGYLTKIHKFSDWSEVDHKNYEKLYEAFGETPHYKICRDPRKTHWEHFIQLQFNFENDLREYSKLFIREVFDKLVVYNDLFIKNGREDLTITILDWDQLCEFVQKIDIDIDEKYRDYDISQFLIEAFKEYDYAEHMKDKSYEEVRLGMIEETLL